jgi:thioredoxin reductase (NADPH)
MFTLKPPKKEAEVRVKPKLEPKDGIWDVIIIGSGPAGFTAAIYTTRARLSTLLFAGSSWGGQLMTTTTVDNYPGFPEGILGPDLIANMKKQAERFGAKILYEDVVKVNLHVKPIEIFTEEKRYKAKSVIIATGATYRKLGLESESRLAAKGVSYCAVCDGYFFRDQRVVVVGGGDSALHDALFLSNLASEVIIIHRRDKFRGEVYLQEQVFNNPKIKVVFDTIVIDIVGKDKVEGVKIKNVKTGKEGYIECEGVFIAIGHVPASDIFKDQIELRDSGHIKVKDFVKTSVPGVFAAGDVADYKYRQAVTAAAYGAMAAIEAEKYIRKNTYI